MICVNTSRLQKLQGNMTDEQFAKLMNISRQHLVRVKNSKNSVGEKMLKGFKKSFPNEDVNEYFFLSRRAEERE